MATIKPTFKDPMSDQSEKFEKDFKKTMVKNQLNIRETNDLNEVDDMLSEVEQSLKKKIFSLAKMEALVFSDPKLSAVYEEMSENGEEKYGYHYNETIQNMIFNDYVLNSPKYLQKYKMAIPKEKKRRDKSGINQLKKAGAEKMSQSGLPKQKKEVSEADETPTKVVFLINDNEENADLFAYFPEEIHDEKYNMGYSHIGQHSAVHPEYAAESREASPEEYQNLKAELEGQGYVLDVLNGLQESSTAGSAGGAAGYVGYAGPAAWSTKGDLLGGGKKKGGGNTGRAKPINKPISKVISISESQYLTDPTAFGKYFKSLNEESDADFVLNNSQAYGSIDNMNSNDQKIIKKDIQNGKLNNNSNIKDGIALQEKSKSKSQQRFFGMVDAVKSGELSPEKAGEKVAKAARDMTNKDVDDFASTKHKGLPEKVKEDMENTEKNTQYNPMEQDDFVQGLHANTDRPNVSIEDRNKLIDYLKKNIITPEQKIEYVASRIGNPEYVKNMPPNVINDMYFRLWATEHNVFPDPDAMKEDTQTMIQNNSDSMSNKAQATGDMSSEVPMGTQQSGGLNEADDKLLEEINKELEAFSVHHDKLKLMSEDRKTTSQIINKRVTDENPKNFKKDLQHSGTKEILDVEKELEWKDQQTDVKDPQKLGQDIEKQEIKVADMKSDEALKNVGDSANQDGDEIPKRNLTTDEQDEVNLYRKGLHSPVFDNEVGERYEERMKADMGDDMYKQRQDQIEFQGEAPTYNKDPQPIGKTPFKKVEFDKEAEGWNDRMGKPLKESMLTGSYRNHVGERHLIDFNLDEVSEINEETSKKYFKLDFTGLGNTYNSKTVDNKVVVNEGIVGIMESHKFYTNGKAIFTMKNPVQSLNENEEKESKPVISEEFKKMKHLLGYKPDAYVNTNNVKKNRGF